MKKAVKRRIQALEIGIQACQKRMNQLVDAVRPEECPLCEAYNKISAWCCDDCPAYRKTVDSVLTCNEYAPVIEDLIARLTEQRDKWASELGKLRGVK